MTSDPQDPNKQPASRPGPVPSLPAGGRDAAIPTLTTPVSTPSPESPHDDGKPAPLRGGPGRDDLRSPVDAGGPRTHEVGGSRLQDAGGPPPPEPGVERAAPPPRSGAGNWPWLLLLLLVITAALAAWLAQERFHSVERDGEHRIREVADRTQNFDGRIRVTEEIAQQMKAGLGEVQSRVSDVQSRVGEVQNRFGEVQSRFAEVQNRFGAVDGKLADAAARQAQIEGLYNDIIKARSTSALSDVQQSVAIATRYLQLHNNVPGAVAILEDGAKVLDAADPADSTGIRKRILSDIEKLRAVPTVDLNALVVRLDHVLDNVGRMPLMAEADDVPGEKVDLGAPASDPQAQAPAAPSKAGESAEPGAWAKVRGWFDQAVDIGSRGVESARDQLKDAVAIQKVDQPDLLLLAPQQREYARDNLRLMLLNARLDLLNGRQELFRNDVARAAQGIRQLFDTRNAEVMAAVATLDQLKTAVIDVPLPSLAETAAAISSLKSSTEKR